MERRGKRCFGYCALTHICAGFSRAVGSPTALSTINMCEYFRMTSKHALGRIGGTKLRWVMIWPSQTQEYDSGFSGRVTVTAARIRATGKGRGAEA